MPDITTETDTMNDAISYNLTGKIIEVDLLFGSSNKYTPYYSLEDLVGHLIYFV